MATGRAFLTALAVLAVLLCCGSGRAADSCLRCHPPHYRGLGSCVGCHRGDPRSDRLRVAHYGLVAARFSWSGVPGSAPVERGNRLLETFACRRCHNAAGRGNRLASNLDLLPAGTTPENLFASIDAPALQMPDFKLEQGAITDLVNALLAGTKGSAKKGKETPRVVHFETAGKGENVFEKKCGPCHKVLTAALGGVGRGSVGPNLSGLFSEFYPPTVAGKERWSAPALEKWLKNPRQSRPSTQMRPVPLKKEELERLLQILDAPPRPGASKAAL
ncbi:selenite/tellurite reduction operon c-type cytochrome lipoprotein ExtS [Citrifermentans bremense]|uniref:selenite/tellurite reduction operon c-type cytochrome lipoprotein ExtS n=1 Tax=Citrifermentans bremense TaxID=60035 RepID=UPI00047DFBC4|nr:selenite/tellurite reduction operon c-type cytochrome lipoprotein ExtS [Citrifermentans bremense]